MGWGRGRGGVTHLVDSGGILPFRRMSTYVAKVYCVGCCWGCNTNNDAFLDYVSLLTFGCFITAIYIMTEQPEKNPGERLIVCCASGYFCRQTYISGY